MSTACFGYAQPRLVIVCTEWGHNVRVHLCTRVSCVRWGLRVMVVRENGLKERGVSGKVASTGT